MPTGIDNVTFDYGGRVLVMTRMSEFVWGFSVLDDDRLIGSTSYDFESLNLGWPEVEPEIDDCVNALLCLTMGVRENDAHRVGRHCTFCGIRSKATVDQYRNLKRLVDSIVRN